MNILIPALILGIYTLLFLFYMGLTRRKAVQTGEMDPRYYRTYTGGEEPERLRILSRHFSNLLEVPVLFYAVVVMIYAAGASSALFVGLAWLYVALRFVHAYIHLSSNFILHRFLVFGISALVLLLMWVLLLIRFLF
ncbi:MAG: hypothetical protein HKN70_05480 [Gammaproteobacteria bacterium]|nr:hypothetical protein [Gammaproteobacteria bacterium]